MNIFKKVLGFTWKFLAPEAAALIPIVGPIIREIAIAKITGDAKRVEAVRRIKDELRVRGIAATDRAINLALEIAVSGTPR